MLAVGRGAECRVDEWSQGLSHVVLESSHHVLHCFPHLWRTKRLSTEIGDGLPRAPGIAIRHYDNHRLRFRRGDQVIENEISFALPRPTGFILAPAVLEVK